MPDKTKPPTEADLRSLPRRAIVAFAARSAKMALAAVMPRVANSASLGPATFAADAAADFAATRPEIAEIRAATEAAEAVVAAGIHFAARMEIQGFGRYAAAAAKGMRLASNGSSEAVADAMDAAANAAFSAASADECAHYAARAAAAANAASPTLLVEIWSDYELLSRLSIEKVLTRSSAVPAALFSTNVLSTRRALQAVVPPAGIEPIEVYLDPGDASTEVIQELLKALSDLNVAAGGLGLEFRPDGATLTVAEVRS